MMRRSFIIVISSSIVIIVILMFWEVNCNCIISFVAQLSISNGSLTTLWVNCNNVFQPFFILFKSKVKSHPKLIAETMAAQNNREHHPGDMTTQTINYRQQSFWMNHAAWLLLWLITLLTQEVLILRAPVHMMVLDLCIHADLYLTGLRPD